MTPDVNVLLAAFRFDHPQHRIAFEWLQSALAGATTGRSFVLLPMAVSGFIRLATHEKVFREPAPPEAAIAFIDSLLAVPGVQTAELGREWPAFCRQLRASSASGNDVPDAWIAAAVQTLGENLATFDRGFVRLLGRNELTLLRPG
ncbi:MAG: TA system VapC family ribonuclease toxin [Steroidobacteraceae bacterium]